MLAVAAIPAVATNAPSAKPLVWVFNVWGSLDLAYAIFLATILEAAPMMGPAYWIPAFWVPALLVTHYTTFLILLRPGGRSRRGKTSLVSCIGDVENRTVGSDLSTNAGKSAPLAEEPVMPTITPFLWFDTQAEEAMNFYAGVFKRSKVLDRQSGAGTR